MTNHSMLIFRVSPFFSNKTTLKQQLNSKTWDVEYLAASGWAVLQCKQSFLFQIFLTQIKEGDGE